MTETELEAAFRPSLENPVFQEVLELVKQNSEGNIWIIGGFLYRNIAARLYGGPAYDADIDFIVEKKNEVLKPVDGWRIEPNSYGNPSYVRDTHEMSFFDLNHIIRVVPLAALTMEAYLESVPLTIQSLAYDLGRHQLIGPTGMQALRSKTIGVHLLPQAEFYASRKKRPLEEIIKAKAKDLGFTPII